MRSTVLVKQRQREVASSPDSRDNPPVRLCDNGSHLAVLEAFENGRHSTADAEAGVEPAVAGVMPQGGLEPSVEIGPAPDDNLSVRLYDKGRRLGNGKA